MSSFFSAKNFSIFALSLYVNFNESLTNDVVSFEQLGHDNKKLMEIQKILTSIQQNIFPTDVFKISVMYLP